MESILAGSMVQRTPTGNFVLPTPADKPIAIEFAGRRVTLTGGPATPANLAASPYSDDEVHLAPRQAGQHLPDA